MAPFKHAINESWRNWIVRSRACVWEGGWDRVCDQVKHETLSLQDLSRSSQEHMFLSQPLHLIHRKHVFYCVVQFPPLQIDIIESFFCMRGKSKRKHNQSFNRLLQHKQSFYSLCPSVISSCVLWSQSNGVHLVCPECLCVDKWPQIIWSPFWNRLVSLSVIIGVWLVCFTPVPDWQLPQISDLEIKST